MRVLYMSNNIAVKVNYQYKIFKIYDNGLVPMADYHTTDEEVSCNQATINNLIKKLTKDKTFIKA